MGLFNTVRIKSEPNGAMVEVQFKYGDLWSHVYRIGEKVVPSEDQTGSVSVPGLGGQPDGYFKIVLKDWIIEAVEKVSMDEWHELDEQMG